MKRISIVLIPVLFFGLQFVVAQTSPSAEPLKDSVEHFKKLGNYSKAIDFSKKWAEKAKKANGEKSPEYAAAVFSEGNMLRITGKYKDAEPLLLQSYEIRKSVLGENHAEVGACLNSLGTVYNKIGDYPKCESFTLKALDVRRQALGDTHADVAATHNNLGILYSEIGQYPKAEMHYQMSLEIHKKVFGDKHPYVAINNTGLGMLYDITNDYAKSEACYLQALEIQKKTYGNSHPQLVSTLSNLGGLYTSMGNLTKAETFLLQALEIEKKTFGEKSPMISGPLNNLGNVYAELGDYLKAEVYYVQALELFRTKLGNEHPDLAKSLLNQGNFYRSVNNITKAEKCILEALEINKKSLGPAHESLGDVYNSLGILYKMQGNYAKSISCLNQALEITKKAHSENHFMVGTIYHNLASTYRLKGEFAKATAYYKNAFDIQKKALGEVHPRVISATEGLSINSWESGDMVLAGQQFAKYQEMDQKLIQRFFPSLSDHGREQFLEKGAESRQLFQSFCGTQFRQNPALAGILYNERLLMKGLLLNSAAKWKQRIKTSGDMKLVLRLNEWEVLRNKIAKLFSSTDSSERASLSTLLAQSEKLEKELTSRSENFAKMTDRKVSTWQDVQKALKPGEAAIEIVRIRKFGNSSIVTDTSDQNKPTYKTKSLTDTVHYAVLVVKKESTQPELLLLENGNMLEGKFLRAYIGSVKNGIADKTSYDQFWGRIDARLKGVLKIYFSADGVYQKINLNILKNPKTGKFLIDEKDIRLVTSTKDIINPGVPEEENKLACLMGYPEFEKNIDQEAVIASSNRATPSMAYIRKADPAFTLSELPGTKIEVESIGTMLTKNGWEVKSFLGNEAAEEHVKDSYKPRILHLATHGFFEPDTTKNFNSLLNSGLMLSGATNTFRGQKQENSEDGVLTTYEAMNLNLDNTDLVVLSACETGLGEIKNGEGVYGLQRAFKVAGAKSIIMSMWEVDDDATQELMVSFYKYWLGNAVGLAGQTANGAQTRLSAGGGTDGKRSAFLKAQKELKAKYPNPNYWGAFVMVGE